MKTNQNCSAVPDFVILKAGLEFILDRCLKGYVMQQPRPFAVFSSRSINDQALNYKTPKGTLVTRIYSGFIANWNQNPENLAGIVTTQPNGAQQVRYYDQGKLARMTKKKLSPQVTDLIFSKHQENLENTKVPKVRLAKRNFIPRSTLTKS
jgi:hypothetical protein